MFCDKEDVLLFRAIAGAKKGETQLFEAEKGDTK
jgi:hypothetical protein